MRNKKEPMALFFIKGFLDYARNDMLSTLLNESHVCCFALNP